MTLTGLAVDYTAHLAHAYMESKEGARLERVHDAFRIMGISVFWGLLTPVISAMTLASCPLQDLAKFGTFFLLTTAWAYAWAVLFLMPILFFFSLPWQSISDSSVAQAGWSKVPALSSGEVRELAL